jgi:site-specific DNA recombinase
MIAAYIRKSPDDKKESDKIENQRKVILGYAKSNGLTISEDAFYIDDQTSGYVVDESLAFFDRKNWNRMMEDIRNKKLQMVLLKDYTRLGRRAGPFLIAVEQITKHGCKLIDCTSNSEIRPSDDRIIFDAYFSERYVRDISGKVRSLFASKQKEGSLVMNNKFGYEKNKKTGLIVNEEIRPCIELIFKLYIGGLGFEKIAQYLNDSTEYPTPSQHYENTKHEKGESCKYKTDRNCHFGFFAVSGQNSVFPPNYDCFRTPNN